MICDSYLMNIITLSNPTTNIIPQLIRYLIQMQTKIINHNNNNNNNNNEIL